MLDMQSWIAFMCTHKISKTKEFPVSFSGLVVYEQEIAGYPLYAQLFYSTVYVTRESNHKS